MTDFKDRFDRSIDEIKAELDELGTYEIIKVNVLPEQNGIGLVLSHKKTKARVSVVLNDDDNKVFAIGFRTPPTNSKGIQHIVEHTVLCGSKKYPAKDPFVELAKGSLNTFLNAMTYGDKTVYPIASCNDKDFHNLMDVYLDAVFNPNIYSREEIFKQEGWHYELADKDSDVIINGVVYNEMRGVYSSPDNVLADYVNQKMYPDSPYGVDSGGDPDVIPTLSREEYLDYHKNYYHPSNSYIYFYGDLDVVENLKYIDEDYLKDYNYLYVPSEIPEQKSFDAPLYDKTGYSITQDEAEDSESIISYNVVTGKCTDKYLNTALNILQYILIDSPGAPLKKAIIDAGICADVESMLDNTMLQPLFTIVAREADAKDAETFNNLIEENLKKYVEEGLDKEALEAALNIFEFKYKEANSGRYPKGLMLGLTDFAGWLYDDSLAQDSFTMQEVYDYLREGINKNHFNPDDSTRGYFEELIQRMLLDNNHKSVIVAEPVVDLNADKDKALVEKLADYKSHLSDEEIDALIADTQHLKDYQTEPSTPEELATIPLLDIEDINKEPRKLYNRETEVSGVKVIAHDIFTNGITYVDMFFDASDMKYEDLGKLQLIIELLKYVDTDEHTYNDLTKKINLFTGGIAFNTGCFNRIGMDVLPYVCCKFKTFDNKLAEGFKLSQEIITTSHITDKKRIREIISEIKASGKISLVEGGHSTAKGRAFSYIDKGSKILEALEGVEYFRFIDYLDKNFDDIIDSLTSELEVLYKKMFRKDKMIISYTSDKNESVMKEPLDNLLSVISDEKISDDKMIVPMENLCEGFKTSSKVQYVAVAADYKKAGLKFNGALNLLKTILSYDYLWINVRVKGGAYGCMCEFNQFGYAFFVSYRDPNLKETYAVYKKALEYVENFDCSDRDMTKYIIGTMSNVDLPLTPSGLGSLSFAQYITNITDEERKINRKTILTANQETIRGLAPYIKVLSESDVLCTVGGEEKVNADADIFKTVSKLI